MGGVIFISKGVLFVANIYHAFYTLLQDYIFGGTVVVGSYEDLVCIIVSTIAALLLVAFPFIIVWRIIRVFL